VARGIALPRLARLFRTSSFRLTLFYAVAFGASVAVLLAVVTLSATDFMARQIDGAVDNEIAELKSAAAGHGVNGLAAVVRVYARRSSGFSYLLQDSGGHVLAGNMEGLRPIEGRRNLRWPHRSAGGTRGAIRGRGLLLSDGAYLFVGVSSFELGELQEVILRASLIGLAVTMALGITGGLVTSAAVLRRVETVDRTRREIMAGDLTRRIAVRGTGDEFDRLATGLNAMFDRIQQLMAGLQQVSSDIAHDLRTPLTRLRQRLELAYRRHETVDELRGALEASIRDSDAILETFAALLRIAQIESGSRQAGFKETSVAELLCELADAYEPVADQQGRELVCVIEGSPLVVFGDRELLAQLFANLVENALQHAPGSHTVTLSAIGDAQTTEVTVADNGPGIPFADRERVLQRFVRLDASRHSPGTGLGLSLVAAIATLHGAQLDLEDNRPGLRCVVRFATRAKRPGKVSMDIR
jgi:signal transduction histidine kinase